MDVGDCVLSVGYRVQFRREKKAPPSVMHYIKRFTTTITPTYAALNISYIHPVHPACVKTESW